MTSRSVLAAMALAGALALGCQRKATAPVNLNVANNVADREVMLYFEGEDLLLAPEMRKLALPSNDAAAISEVLRELLKGPADPRLAREFPPDTVVRAAYLLPEGTAIVDLGGETLSHGWATGAHQEMMAIYSTVQTVVGNFPKARRVRVLMNGAPAETLGGHVALDRPLVPISALVRH